MYNSVPLTTLLYVDKICLMNNFGIWGGQKVLAKVEILD